MPDFTNTGLLFKNTDKASDKHPDFQGSIEIQCDHCGQSFARQLAGWIKLAKTGSKYLALSCRPKRTAMARRQNEDMF